MNRFAEILLPLSLPGTFTYEIPQSLLGKADIGKRVVVPFGKKKLYSGLIIGLKNESEFALTKEILDVIDEKPVINNTQLQFWQWISDYYLCYAGEVMHAAMPTGMRFDSETIFSLLQEPDNLKDFHETEQIVINTLKHKSLSTQEIEKLLHKKNVFPIIKKLLQEGIITGDEVLKNQYKAKTETYYQLVADLPEGILDMIIKKWNKNATKQLEILNEIIYLSPQQAFIPQKTLTKKFGVIQPTIKKLTDHGIIKTIQVDVSRFDEINTVKPEHILLSGTQQKAYNEIQESFIQHEVTLLHGVTASGKTHLYIKLIDDMLQRKMQTLYLLPEIALTSQIIKILKSYFGNKVGIYHSKFNSNERVEIWNKVINEEYQIVLGVRSALFLPFQHLGLIIVDEEHDSSYKQHDPSPRYHARDAAVMLAKITDAKVLLGTATPSLETYYNVQEGKYGLVTLYNRFMNVNLPEITVVNTKEAVRKKQMQSHFSNTLIEEINITLRQQEQVILFQNRRGYAPFIQCGECAHVPHCKSCDVSLTYHKYINKLKCHICGYTENNHTRCNNCGSHDLKMVGMGTEKIESETAILFPQARIDRLDIDTARGKEAHKKIIEKFEEQETDILVGTQMLSKGLNFDKVRLVGVINVDQMLNYPDFRSAERTFQLVSQVSGRAGRKDGKGLVILQTSRPQHPVVQFASTHDFQGFYQYELETRKQFFYPPFSRLIHITLKHKDLNALQQAAHIFIKQIELPDGVKKLGPVTPIISRIKNLYLLDVILKVPKNNAVLNKVKTAIKKGEQQLQQNSLLKGIIFQIDVDTF